MIKVIIIDDDELCRKNIEYCVNRNPELDLVGVFESATIAQKELESLKCDLIISDVEMPELSGLEFVSFLDGSEQIIIVSGKREYAAEAFNFNVTDYIVKPVGYERFLQAISKYKKIDQAVKIKKSQSKYFYIKASNGYVKLAHDDIKYIEACADYIHIYTSEERHIVLSTMKAIQHRLPSDNFIRIHRSYIVPIKKITKVKGNKVLINDISLPIGRSKKKFLIESLNDNQSIL